ncbi:MAG TPA: YggT family protein [bacterium]
MVALIRFLSDAYIFVIFVRVILSWIRHNPYHPLIRIVYQITEPPLSWIRRYVPNFGGLDLSPMILIFAVILLEKIIIRILVL